MLFRSDSWTVENVGYIGRRDVTVTPMGSKRYDKVYDGTVHLVSGLLSFVKGEDYTLSGFVLGEGTDAQFEVSAAWYDDKDVGVDRNVTIQGGLTGTGMENYAVTVSMAGVGTISKRELGINFTTALIKKAYDGTTNAIAALRQGEHYTLTNVVTGEEETLTLTGTGTFSDKNVGTGKTVNFTGLTLSGKCFLDKRIIELERICVDILQIAQVRKSRTEIVDIDFKTEQDASMFSFHATKVFNTIEGGAAACRDLSIKEKLDKIKNFGIIDKENIVCTGGNAKMNEFQAAMGLCNLKHIEEMIALRKNIAQRYIERLSGIRGIVLNEYKDNIKYNYAYMPVRIDTEEAKASRDVIYKALAEQGIYARKQRDRKSVV